MVLAEEAGLDLVEISPNANPPVCKVMDFGKYKYEQQKREAEARRKQKTIDIKEIKFRPNTDTHDYEVKMKSVVKFLANVALGIRVESIRDGGRMSQETDNTTICNNLKVPVLILSGAKDTVISAEMHASLIAALPGASEVVFPKAGHASYAEYPDQFNHQVTEFAKKVWKLNETKLTKTRIN